MAEKPVSTSSISSPLPIVMENIWEDTTQQRPHRELQSGEKTRKSKVERRRARERKLLDKQREPNQVEEHLAQLRLQQSRRLVPRKPEIQAGDEESATDNAVGDKVVAENIAFTDEALSQRLVMGDMYSGDYDADADSSAGLGAFLSRPVRIASFTWPENSTFNALFTPWSNYFSNAEIKKKLDNYGKISCRLHLKFILNASPFYYGSLRACYFPLADERSVFNDAVDQVPFSQTPGVYLEPQNMSTAEMVLPFLWQRNWLEATAAVDFTNMGIVRLIQYANLRSANGVSGSGITVAVYAWAEDVRVMGPTTKAALQSDEYDESNGVVSGPATAVANVADRLTDVPVIGSFASATSMGAKAVAGIAKLFGYSNPPMIDDVQPVQSKTFHALANVETRFPIDKLSVDPKNEVTISGSVAGVDNEDPLAFCNLLTRESFMIGTLWSGSQAVDTLLWSALVSPGLLVSNGTYAVYSPVSYFSHMFRFWRGSIVFKFRFIKTKYHKGRVLISWDPNGDISATTDTETTTFSRVVDLAVEDEVEMVIPYKGTAPWLYTNQTTYISNGTAPTYPYDAERYNGCITMRVQNVLTGPAALPQIDVLTYMRAGDDFMYSVPTKISDARTTHDPNGVLQSEEVSEVITQQPVSVDSQVGMITTGETISSLRPILHRASLAYRQPAGVPIVGTTAGIQATANYIWRIPDGVGRTPDGYGYATVSSAGVPYYFGPNHPIHWVLECFVGVRGSVNVHVNVVGIGTNVPRVSHLSVQRHYGTAIINTASYMRNAEMTTEVLTAWNNISRQVVRTSDGGRDLNPAGQTGMSLTNVQTQAGMSVNVPQYSRFRFLPAFHTQRHVDQKTEDTFYDELQVSCGFTSATTMTATTDWPVLEYYYAAGVDFQPIFFLCTPRVWTIVMPNARDVYP